MLMQNGYSTFCLYESHLFRFLVGNKTLVEGSIQELKVLYNLMRSPFSLPGKQIVDSSVSKFLFGSFLQWKTHVTKLC